MYPSRLLNRLAVAWVCCYATLAWAGTTLSQDVRGLGIDWESYGWAAAAGLLGGIGRTLLTMASDKRVMFRLPPESWRDALVAALAGVAAYVAVQGTSAGVQAYLNLPSVPREMRQLILVAAGWLGLRFFGKLDRLGTVAVGRLEKQINGGDLPPEPAAPAADAGSAQ